MATEEDVQLINTALEKVSGQLKEHAERAQHDRQLAEENKGKVDELLTQQTELQANLQSAEQHIAKLNSGSGRPERAQSYGRQFVEGEKFKEFSGQTTPRGRVDMTFNAAVHSVTTDYAGDLVEPTRYPGIIAAPERSLTVRDLITQGRMDGNTLEYVQETGFTNSANTVKEGEKKPQSDLEFELKSTTAKVIAHSMKASRQILDDASQLASNINGKLLYGLKDEEENQLLNGDGTGQNLNGIITQAEAFSDPLSMTSPTVIDTLRLALLQAELAEYPSTGIVLHPNDWARIELEKDDNDRHLIGNPQGRIGATLWGVDVVTTKAIDDKKFLAGAFKMGAQLFDRWLARVEVSTENEDDFIKNMVTVLAEERLALAVFRPEAFVYGDTSTT